MSRKTVEVEPIKDWINKILDPKQCPELGPENRQTAATILSGILHDSGNYKGFRFLDMEFVTDVDGMIVDTVIPDETARRYY
jgi:hypothetical protein